MLRREDEVKDGESERDFGGRNGTSEQMDGYWDEKARGATVLVPAGVPLLLSVSCLGLRPLYLSSHLHIQGTPDQGTSKEGVKKVTWVLGKLRLHVILHLIL